MSANLSSMGSAVVAKSALRQVALLTLLAIVVAFLGARLVQDAVLAHLLNNLQWTIANCMAPVIAWLGYRVADNSHRPTLRWLAIGMTAYGIGQLGFDIAEWTGRRFIPGNLFYLACGPLVTLGFFICLRQRVPGKLRSTLFDIAALTLAVLAFILAIYLVGTADIGALQLTTLAAFPISMLGSAMFGLVMIPALGLRISAGSLLLLGGLLGKGGLWMIWNVMALVDARPSDGSGLNFGFALTGWMLGVGAATWRADVSTDLEWQRRCHGLLLLLPLVAVAIAIASLGLIWAAPDMSRAVQAAIMLGVAAVVILALLRQSLLVSEHERLLTAEREVAETNRQFKVLAQRLTLATAAAGSGIWDMDLLSRETVWDARMYALYGRSATDQASPRSMWNQSVHPEDMTLVHTLCEQALVNHTELNLEFRIIRPDGELRYLEAHAVIQFDAQNQPVRLIGVTWDVTERVMARRALTDSEAELSAIFENSVIGIVLLGKDRTVLRSNRAARQLLGYSQEQVARMPAEDAIHPEDREHSVQMFNELVAGAVVGYQREKRYLRASGEPLWVRVTLYPVALKDAHDYVCLIEDISHRKQVEENLLEVQRNELRVREEFAYQLLTAQEQERQRIANELHDSIGQSLSLIKNRTVLAMEQAGASAAVLRQLSGMLKLTADAIIEVRGLAHNLRPLHIEELGLTTSLQALLDYFAQSSKLVVESRLENIDDVFSREQLTHVYRIVQESLNNVLKHADSSRLSIIIERDVSVVRMVIRDDGRGFVVDQAAARTGLGLTSIKERAHMLGGTLQIDSTPGAGTRLQIELPINDQDGAHGVDEPGIIEAI